VILLMLLIALTLIIIAMAVAAPKLAQQIKRDREIEMIHRGAQYARAVKTYYKKFGRYPANIEQLENTNNIRFLRKAYTDPTSKNGKWRPVRFGEVQLGQQGRGPGTIGGTGGALPGVVGSLLNQGGDAPSTETQPSSGQLQADSGADSGSASNSSTQTPQSGLGQPSGFGQPSAFGQPGQTFGGGAILGVASTSKATGFFEYNDKSKYNQWLFIYDPTIDRGGLITGPYNPKAFVGQNAPVGTPAGLQPGSQITGSPGFSNSPTPTPSQPANQDTPLRP
jgi:type II secretory pathway pseudopilin PulG